jgi:hypothetical protein
MDKKSLPYPPTREDDDEKDSGIEQADGSYSIVGERYWDDEISSSTRRFEREIAKIRGGGSQTMDNVTPGQDVFKIMLINDKTFCSYLNDVEREKCAEIIALILSAARKGQDTLYAHLSFIRRKNSNYTQLFLNLNRWLFGKEVSYFLPGHPPRWLIINIDQDEIGINKNQMIAVYNQDDSHRTKISFADALSKLKI